MERLHATHPLRVSGLVLIAVQRVRVEHHGKGGRSWVHVFAEPHALVVVEGGRPRALDPTGADIPLKPLLREAAGLAEALRTIA